MSARRDWTNVAMSEGLYSEAEDGVLRRMWTTHSHGQIARELGRTEKSVRNRCWRLGLIDASKGWTPEEIATLRAAYAATTNEALDLDGLAARLDRTPGGICQKAASLGLTNHRRAGVDTRKSRRKFANAEDLRRHQSERQKKTIAERGHPRGMLGKKHSQATRQRLRETSAAANAAVSQSEKTARALKAMKTKVAKGVVSHRTESSWKSGWRVIGGARKYYRSTWEANYARYLEWLRARGEIAKWEHEPETFWFSGVKRGAVSYLPDFRVTAIGGGVCYHEVKGWMDARSRTKIKRMRIYHPAIRLIVVDSAGYRALAKTAAALVPGWELPARSR